MRLTRALAAILGMLLALAGCEDNKPAQIQWQLPLEAPEDPHGGAQNLGLPEWAAAVQGEAELVWLHKPTARLYPQRLELGAAGEMQGWKVELLGLASGLRIEHKAFLNDENVDNPAAFVRISRDGKPLYTGWLFARFPELFGIDDPDWKVWLKGIKLRPASDEARKT